MAQVHSSHACIPSFVEGMHCACEFCCIVEIDFQHALSKAYVIAETYSLAKPSSKIMKTLC